ncbi:hypothetical protein ACXR2U_18940 [Jatrophihabitans sp. YIM 134969]
MAGKNKGGREAKKPKTKKPKLNMSQPTTKGVAELTSKNTTKRPNGR